MNIFRSSIKLVLIFCLLLTSCTYKVGNMIKLEDFPKQAKVDDLNIYRYTSENDAMTKDHIRIDGFKPILLKAPDYKKPDKMPKSGCILEMNISSENPSKAKIVFNYIYVYISFFTLFTIPFYGPIDYTITAQLIDAKTKTVLKKYDFTEKFSQLIVGPIPLLIWAIPVIIKAPFDKDFGKRKPYDSTNNSAMQVMFDTQHKLEKAVIRQVTNDAHQFAECRK